MYQKIVGCSKFHIQHISQDQIEKLKNFVVDMEEEHMELIQQKQIVKVTYATHWIQMENVQYANSIGSAANVRSLYALFGGYSHNSEVFE